MRRVIDLIMVVLLGLIFAPLMLLITIVSFFCQGRPIIFRHVRICLHGQPFVLFKFRTMRVDAPSHNAEPEWVTSWGGILRRWKVDELPQLWNILCGEMSLVGPRPESPAAERGFSVEVKTKRHSVKPGLIGPAQVWGAGRDNPAQKEVLEELYLQRRKNSPLASFLQDATLVLLTPLVMAGIMGTEDT